MSSGVGMWWMWLTSLRHGGWPFGGVFGGTERLRVLSVFPVFCLCVLYVSACLEWNDTFISVVDGKWSEFE